jgi:hypothetical protein
MAKYLAYFLQVLRCQRVADHVATLTNSRNVSPSADGPAQYCACAVGAVVSREYLFVILDIFAYLVNIKIYVKTEPLKEE